MQKKQVIQFAVLLVLILALTGAYFAIQSYNASQDEKKAQQEKDAVITLTSFQPESITGIRIDTGGDICSLQRNGENWTEESDSETLLSTEKTESFLKEAGDITAASEIEPEEDADYGFDEPLRTGEISTEKGTSSLIFGMKNEMLGQYYLKTSESGSIYLAEESVYALFDKTAEDFVKEPETDTDADTDAEDE